MPRHLAAVELYEDGGGNLALWLRSSDHAWAELDCRGEEQFADDARRILLAGANASFAPPMECVTAASIRLDNPTLWRWAAEYLDGGIIRLSRTAGEEALSYVHGHREPGREVVHGSDLTTARLRRQMVELMSYWSEGHWAAGWHSDLCETIRREGGLWTLMAAACGGWPQGYEGRDGWAPLTDVERIEVRLASQPSEPVP